MKGLDGGSIEYKDADTWDMVSGMARNKQLVSGVVLSRLANTDDRICVLHADSGLPTRVDAFGVDHPHRYFNFGIAERNMVSAAAGLAAVGYRPYLAGYASFLSLMCVEQIRTDLSYPGYPVRLLASNAGVSTGTYGTTHHATEDIGALSSIAGLTILSPVDSASLEHALESTTDVDGPIYFRLGNGTEPTVYDDVPDDWGPGSSVVLRPGRDVSLLATGVCVSQSLAAASILEDAGISCAVVDMCSLKPLDHDRVGKAAETGLIITVEDHNVVGGLGSHVASSLATSGTGASLVCLGLPDKHAPAKPRAAIYEHFGLDPRGIASRVMEALDRT